MLIKAYINHGRWVADCPQCNNAELVSGKAFFTCQSCGLSEALQFPNERVEIEALLGVRPELNRNWYPYETIADLRIENAAFLRSN